MTKDDTVAVGAGIVTAAHQILESTYVEAALKGLIGGVLGYAGKLLLSWAIKKIKGTPKE